MKNCPSCGHKLYGEQGESRYCKFCGYTYKTNEDSKVPKVKMSRVPSAKKTGMQRIRDLAEKSIHEYDTFFHDFEEDLNIYAKLKQDEEMKKLLKRVVTRINRINAIAIEEERIIEEKKEKEISK